MVLFSQLTASRAPKSGHAYVKECKSEKRPEDVSTSGLYAVAAAPTFINCLYEGHLESKERFAIQKYLLIIGKKKNMQVL